MAIVLTPGGLVSTASAKDYAQEEFDRAVGIKRGKGSGGSSSPPTSNADAAARAEAAQRAAAAAAAKLAAEKAAAEKAAAEKAAADRAEAARQKIIQTAGYRQALNRAQTGQPLTAVDVRNLRTAAGASGYSTLSSGGVSSRDLRRFLESERRGVTTGAESKQTEQPQPKQPPQATQGLFFSNLKNIYQDFTEPIFSGVAGTSTEQQRQFFTLTQSSLSAASGKLSDTSQKINEFIIPKTTQEEIIGKRLSIYEKKDTLTPFEYQDYQNLKSQEKILSKEFENTPVAFFGSAITGFVRSPVTLAQLGVDLVRQPSTTITETVAGFKALPSQFVEKPFSTSGSLAGEFIGQSIILGGVGRGGRQFAAEISPEFRAVGSTTKLKGSTGEGILNIPTEEVGFFQRGGLTLKTLAGEDTSFFTGKGAVDIDIPFARSVSQITESVSKQAGLAGTKARIVSAQTDFLTPEGSVVGAGEGGLGLFFDPFGRLRVSRFGDTGLSSILELLDAEVGFGIKNRQILFKTNAEIEAFPQSLSGVESKLLSGKTLTASERARLFEFQTTPSGKAKPVGFLSGEPEVTIAPSETILGKRRGVSVIRGEVADIFEIDILKAGEKQRAAFLKELDFKDITGDVLSSSTRKISISPTSSAFKSLSVRLSSELSVSGISGLSISSPPSKSLSSDLNSVNSLGSLSFKSVSLSKSDFPPSPSPTKTSLSGGGSGINRVFDFVPSIIGKEPKNLILPKQDKQKLSRTTTKQGYNIYTKEPKQKKYTKLIPQAVSKSRAEDLLAYSLDNSTARSGYIKSSKQKIKALGFDIPDNYFGLTQHKFRDFKVRAGKKKAFPGIIEFSTYAIDTPGEKRQLSAFKSLSRRQKINSLLSDVEIGFGSTSKKKKRKGGSYINSILNM